MKQFLSYLRVRPTVLVIFLIVLCVVEVHLNLAKFKDRTVIQWDAKGYYSYLPAAFIAKDLTLSFIPSSHAEQYRNTLYDYKDDAEGHHVMKYWVGMSLLYSPFFAIAHVLAKPFGYVSDGYSMPYQLAINFSGLFYLVIGLWFLRKVLRLYYSEKTAAISIAVIFFGTNLLCYSTLEAAMSHGYTFSLFSVFIWYSLAYFKTFKWQHAFLMAFLLGLMVLVRPINLLFALVIPLAGIQSFGEFKQRMSLAARHYGHLVLFIVTLCFVVSVQLAYWYYVTGHLIVSSYGKETFYFNHPHLVQCLIGFRKGWLIYSPLIVISFLGMRWLTSRTNAGFFILIGCLLPIYFYVVSSWWCWWYGGSFGLRAMIDLYPLLAIAMAAFFSKVQTLRLRKRQVVYGMIGLLMMLNVFQTFQYRWNIIHYDAMTFQSYMDAFGKLQGKQLDRSLLHHPDYDKALQGQEE